MARLRAILMHGERSGEGTYEFDVDDKVVHDTPVRIMRAFMEHLDRHANLGHIDYEINGALKNKELGVTTVIGEIAFSATNRQPFTCFISPIT